LHAASAETPLVQESDSTFTSARERGRRVVFRRGSTERIARLEADGATLARRSGPESGNQLLITRCVRSPTCGAKRSRADLRRSRPISPDRSVELTRLDPTIKLEIRYATSNNLFGTPFYTEARAFLQRPAAEALVRVNAALRPRGYGLMVHDVIDPGT